MDDVQVAQGVGYAIIVDRGGYVVGSLLHPVAGIAHGYANAGMTQDGYVVATVAEGNGVFQPDAEVADDFVQPFLLGVAACGHVGEGGVPAANLAVSQAGRYLLFFFLGDEGCQLEYLFALDGLAGWHLGQGRCHLQVFMEYLSHPLVGLAGADAVLAHHDAGYIPVGTVGGQAAHVVGRDGTLVYHLVAHKAVGAVHGDVAIYQPAFPQGRQVVDEYLRASGGYEYAGTFLLRLCQGLDGRSGDFVCVEADEGAVNVEKQSFVHDGLYYLGAKVRKMWGYLVLLWRKGIGMSCTCRYMTKH